jgi:hypothetical protein
MCFSATASFVAAGLSSTIGGLALTRTTQPRELLLAAMPLVFGVQQGIEGLLWLTLGASPDSPLAAGLTMAFLAFAQVLWPIYAPIAVLLVEPERARRQAMSACAVLGAVVSAYLLIGLLTHPRMGALIDQHMVYGSVLRPPLLMIIGLMYLTATTLPLLLSSQRTLTAIGAVILVGSVVAYSFYQHAFQSVWCYFAAAASVMLLFHFVRVRWLKARIATAIQPA